MKTIIIQGAVDGEISGLIEMFPGGVERVINGYRFHEVEYNNVKVIISFTDMGIMNATISTMIGIAEYKPMAVINQGTAGGHIEEIDFPDIVVGTSSVYLNNFKTPAKGKGEGSNALEWTTKGNYSFEIEANRDLLQIAKSLELEGNIHFGKLGSGDLFSREFDRIVKLNEEHGHLSEDMESIAVYKACDSMNVPVIGIRIISNNELNMVYSYDDTCNEAHVILNNYVMKFLDALIESGMTN